MILRNDEALEIQHKSSSNLWNIFQYLLIFICCNFYNLKHCIPLGEALSSFRSTLVGPLAVLFHCYVIFSQDAHLKDVVGCGISIVDVQKALKLHKTLQHRVAQLDFASSFLTFITLVSQTIVVFTSVAAMHDATIIISASVSWIYHTRCFFAISVTSILILVLPAANLHETNRALIMKSYSINENHPVVLSEASMLKFLANLSCSEGLGLTVMGMFPVTKYIILTLAGVLATYSALFVQFR